MRGRGRQLINFLLPLILLITCPCPHRLKRHAFTVTTKSPVPRLWVMTRRRGERVREIFNPESGWSVKGATELERRDRVTKNSGIAKLSQASGEDEQTWERTPRTQATSASRSPALARPVLSRLPRVSDQPDRIALLSPTRPRR